MYNNSTTYYAYIFFFYKYLKRHSSAFTMDVIARCAFGMKITDLGAENDPFMKHTQTVTRPPVRKSPKVLIPCNHPL